MPIHLRRGPVQRMALRAPKPNRPRTPKATGSVGNHDDEPTFDIPDYEVAAQNPLNFRPAELRSKQEGDGGDHGGGDRDKSRFQKLFSMSEPPTLESAGGAGAAAGARGSRAQSLNRSVALAPAPLPELHSLRDVLSLIHSTNLTDPSCKSAELLQRKISAAVMDNKISLPKIRRLEDVSELLVDVFGKGHQGSTPLSTSQINFHLRLPVWLLNLGRQRTPLQQTHAGARQSLPTTRNITAAAAT